MTAHITAKSGHKSTLTPQEEDGWAMASEGEEK